MNFGVEPTIIPTTLKSKNNMKPCSKRIISLLDGYGKEFNKIKPLLMEFYDSKSGYFKYDPNNLIIHDILDEMQLKENELSGTKLDNFNKNINLITEEIVTCNYENFNKSPAMQKYMTCRNITKGLIDDLINNNDPIFKKYGNLFLRAKRKELIDDQKHFNELFKYPEHGGFELYYYDFGDKDSFGKDRLDGQLDRDYRIGINNKDKYDQIKKIKSLIDNCNIQFGKLIESLSAETPVHIKPIPGSSYTSGFGKRRSRRHKRKSRKRKSRRKSRKRKSRKRKSRRKSRKKRRSSR